jgi:periplasmic divalent cation tolerance protein
MTDYTIITTTYPDKDSAKTAAKILVEQKLAACVQLLPIDSIYSWQGKICEESEVMLLIKTRTALFNEVAEAIKSNHSYQVPEIVQIPIIGGSSEYLGWIGDEIRED